MQNQNTDYSPVIEELKKAYKNYIIAKDALIEVGTLTITVGALGLLLFFGPAVSGSLMFCSVLAVGKAKEAYKKELLNALSIGELGDVTEIEKYYKQLPKKLREEWSDDNFFPKLAKHLKEKFFEDKIFGIDENPNPFCQVELQDYNQEIDNEWVDLSGKSENVVFLQ
ncbi:MAG: hypothetical protein LN567_01835 [Rickettsia endosymbiont of Graphium doson]|nr:hypothetical protein [Rickettsia endosymbiont of Graphium doson]